MKRYHMVCNVTVGYWLLFLLQRQSTLQRHPKGKRTLVVSSWRVRPIMAGKAGQQEPEVAAHIAYSVRKQGEM